MSGPMLPRNAREAMPPADFFEAAKSINLDQLIKGADVDLEAARLRMAQASAELESVSASAYAVFATGDGMAVLQWLLDQTLRKPILPAGLPADQKADFISRREGENAIVWILIQAINRGRDLPPPPRG